MSIEGALLRYSQLNNVIGKKAVSALYPNDFELYIVALELVDSNKETKDYFLFPIQPFSISTSYTPIQSIKKTIGGITVLNTETFSPTETVLQGNFGRKFKFLIGKELINFSSILLKPGQEQKKSFQEFDPSIKTGYGCIKVLENIIKTSNTLDANKKPYSLYLYNLAIGQNYLVKIPSLSFSQNQENNMIWSYSMNVKSLIEVDKIREVNNRSLAVNLAANDTIQKSADSAVSFLTSLI